MGVSNGGDGGPLRWAHKVVRLTEEAMQLVAPAVSPRAFKGGLGEPPTPRGLVDEPILDKEHRFWLVIKHVSSTDKCTLLPLIATGRFGGCGRRAGRVRWRVAPEKQGFEREVHIDMLQVPALPPPWSILPPLAFAAGPSACALGADGSDSCAPFPSPLPPSPPHSLPPLRRWSPRRA
mgnify:CR=1 FL=1